MASVELEGDIENLCEPQIALIRSVIEKRGFDNNTRVHIEAVGKKGDNYVAYVKRITATKQGKDSFEMIAKIAPDNEAIRNAMNTYVMFKNEIVMYSEVLSKYNTMFDDEAVPDAQRFRTPACYGYISDPLQEIILLEDLQESNFLMLDRFKSLTDEEVKLGLKEMAVFHSLAYVFQNRYKDAFDETKHKLINFWATMDSIPQIKGWLFQLEEDVISVLDTKEYKDYVKGTVSQLTIHAADMFKQDTDSKYSIIQQGDCWTNNILFRVVNDVPVETVMIDYQLSKLANPAADIHYFIFNCTDKEIRTKHFNDWIDYYHEKLAKSLANFGLNDDTIYPREQLSVDLKSHAKLSLALTILLANILIRESEDVMDIRETELESKDIMEAADQFRVTKADEKTLLRLKNRIQGCIDTFMHLGYL